MLLLVRLTGNIGPCVRVLECRPVVLTAVSQSSHPPAVGPQPPEPPHTPGSSQHAAGMFSAVNVVLTFNVKCFLAMVYNIFISRRRWYWKTLNIHIYLIFVPCELNSQQWRLKCWQRSIVSKYWLILMVVVVVAVQWLPAKVHISQKFMWKVINDLTWYTCGPRLLGIMLCGLYSGERRFIGQILTMLNLEGSYTEKSHFCFRTL